MGKVLTKEGYKRVDDVQMGDEVLTHNKTYKEVVAHSNKVSQPYILIKGRGIDDLVVSKDTQFYAREIDRNFKTFSQEPDWVSVPDIKFRHYLALPIDLLDDSKQELDKWDTYIELDGYYWVPLQSIEYHHYGRGLELVVDEDSSYTINNILVKGL